MADGVTIKIKADTGEFEKTVKKAEGTAENAAKDVGNAAKKSGEETACGSLNGN